MTINIAPQMIDIAPQMIDTTILITKGDLEHGRSRDCYECPLARAINRYLAPEYLVAVFDTRYTIQRRANAMEAYPMRFEMPSRGRSIVGIIDSNSKTYTLHVPCKVKLPLPVHALRQTPCILPLP